MRAWRPLLWTGFGLLLLAGAWLFLRACGLDGLGLNYCPVPPDHAALMREVEAGERLRDQVHRAEMALTEQPLCAPPPPVPDPAPVTPVTPPIDERVTDAGGRNGKLQFTLLWDTLDDLDLNISCPGGDISGFPGHRGPGICGDGVKDLDANRNLVENVSEHPIENVVWQQDPPQGTYRIEVIEYRSKGGIANTVPFTLRLRWNGQERICHDVVTDLGPAASGGAAAGTMRILTWTLGPELPACDLNVVPTYRGGPSK